MKAINLRRLISAIESGNEGKVRSLLLKTIKINTPDKKTGETPLLRACELGNLEIVESLLDYGADINISDYIGKSPLLVACQHKNLEITKILLNRGAQVNVATCTGTTPLILACEWGNVEVVNMILDRGANVDRFDFLGSTALHFACRSDNVGVLKSLLDHKADLYKEDFLKETPLSLIKDCRMLEAIAEWEKEKNKWTPLRSAWVGAVIKGITHRAMAVSGAASGIVVGGGRESESEHSSVYIILST
jgi:ankyrin repeat protein